MTVILKLHQLLYADGSDLKASPIIVSWWHSDVKASPIIVRWWHSDFKGSPIIVRYDTVIFKLHLLL